MSKRLLQRALRWTMLPLSAAFGAAGCAPLHGRDATRPAWSSEDARQPTADDLLMRWMLPSSNQWARYQKLTLAASVDMMSPTFALENIDTIGEVNEAEDAASVLAERGIPRDAMLVVDLRGAASVAFAARLSKESSQPVAPVMTFNDWPADLEVIPAEETLAALAHRTPQIPGAESHDPIATIPVFMLDAWRLAYAYDPVPDNVTDNRYMLTEADLPSPAALAAAGIRRVVYVVPSLRTMSRERDDLNATFVAYNKAGITMHIVDLAWLRALPAGVVWPMMLGPQSISVVPRATIVTDPQFYASAQGGFGGVYAVPSFGGSGYVGTVG